MIWQLLYKVYWCLVMKTPDFVAWEQQRSRPACTSSLTVQSGQHLFCSLFWKFNKAKFLSSLCSWAGLFESYKVGNPKDRFSNKEALLFHVKDTSCSNKRWDKPLIKFVNNLQIHVTGSPHLFINQIKSFMCNKLVQVTVVFLKKNCQLD